MYAQYMNTILAVYIFNTRVGVTTAYECKYKYAGKQVHSASLHDIACTCTSKCFC